MTAASIPRGAISGHDGLLKLLFRRDDRRLLGAHCLGEIASEIIGAGQMVLHYGGAVDIFSAIMLPTPTYSYAYKNATFDGLRRLEKHPGNPHVRQICRSFLTLDGLIPSKIALRAAGRVALCSYPAQISTLRSLFTNRISTLFW
jgi:hypothetical protein